MNYDLTDQFIIKQNSSKLFKSKFEKFKKEFGKSIWEKLYSHLSYWINDGKFLWAAILHPSNGSKYCQSLISKLETLENNETVLILKLK